MASWLGRFRGVVPRGLVVFALADTILSSLPWVVTAPYLKQLGFTPLEYGLLGSVTAGSSLIAFLVVGWAVDRFGPLKLVVLAITVRSAGYSLLATGNKVLIYASAVMSGLYHPLASIPFDVLVSRICDRRRYHYAYSLIYALFQFGAACGAYLGWVPEILSHHGVNLVSAYRCSIVFSAIASLPLITLILRIGEGSAPRSTQRSDLGLSRLSKVARMPRNVWYVVGKLVIAEVVIGFGAALSIHNISYYFILKYGVGSGELGTMYGFESLVMAVLMLAMPRVSEGVGNPLSAYVLTSACSIPLLVCVTLVNNYCIAATLFVTRTVLMNVASPLFTTFFMSVIPEEHRGKASSVIGLAADLSRMVGRGFGGYLLSKDLELPLRLTAALYVCALTYLMLGFRREAREVSHHREVTST